MTSIQAEISSAPANYLTTEEVAARYRTTAATVRYWRHVSHGPRGTRFGRRVLYAEADLIAWEQKQRLDQGAA